MRGHVVYSFVRPFGCDLGTDGSRPAAVRQSK